MHAEARMALLTCALLSKCLTRTLRNHGTTVTEISSLPSSAGPVQHKRVPNYDVIEWPCTAADAIC